MAIISFSPDTLIDYIPTYGGNRDSDNPCIVKLKFVPFSKVQVYSRMITAKTKGLMDTKKITEATQEIQRKQFIESVESISGFVCEGKEVTTPTEFYDLAPSSLIYELIGAMEDSQKISEGQKKI